MKQIVFLFLLFSQFTFSQTNFDFQIAYNQNPNLPSGILETVAWTRTRMVHLNDATQQSCIGIPKAVGVMGLFENGQDYFKENAQVISNLSGISIADQKANANMQIQAYAKAFSILYNQHLQNNTRDIATYFTLDALSEIPDSGAVNLYAKDAQIYEVMKLMCDANFSSEHNFTRQHYQLASVFGSSNLSVLSARKVQVNASNITTENGINYTLSQAKSTQYGPAIWSPAPPCNFSSRSGTAISAITIHTVQGSYAGAISWAQNCSSSVSYHYVIRSSDGQVTQLVLEEDKAWHVGSENPYTIGYEHEGYVDNPSWYTEAMYNSSADLSRDIVNSGYGIPPLRTFYGSATVGTNTLGNCTKIKGHQHFPNQSHTDPGINWNWEKYYRLINNAPVITTLTNANDPFFDSGGVSLNYTNDERKIWTISPTNATSVTMNFTLFNIELNYDYLFIYDGASINSPLLGTYTGTNSPGSITSTGGSLTIEFRSDCATTAVGWEANYTSVTPSAEPPVTIIANSGTWKTSNFDVVITDSDAETPINGQYYLIADKQTTDNSWQSNVASGFVYETFEDNISNWTTTLGDFTINSGVYNQGNIVESNTNSYVLVNQNFGPEYLYEWEQTFVSTGANQRAGLHFMCSDPTLSNRGESYFIYLRETSDQVHIYSVNGDVFNLELSVPYTIEQATTYLIKVRYSTQTGWIKVYINDVFVSQWQDATPITDGTAISLRTGNCSVDYNNIKMYRSRNNLIPVTVGNFDNIRYESVGAIETGMIEALSVDGADMWSLYANATYLIDRSAPTSDFVSDGNAADVDTSATTTLYGNWSFTDIHSGIASYEYAIGTSAGATDVLTWTNTNLNTAMSHILASPVYDQNYYLSIRSTNEAGLYSTYNSDGQLIVSPDAALNAHLLDKIIIYPIPTSNELNFKNIEQAIQVVLIDINGRTILSKTITSNDAQMSLVDVSAGEYSLLIQSGGQLLLKKVSVIH